MWWVLFASVALLLLVGIDAYVLRWWARLVQHRRWSPWLARVGWGVGAVMAGLLVLFWVSRRWSEPALTPLTGGLYAVLTLWYLPKVLLLPFLLVSDAVAAVWRRFRVRERSVPAHPGRRQFVTVMGLGAATLPFLVVGKSMVQTTYRARVFRVELPVPNLPAGLEGMRIVQLSDLHAGSFSSDRFFWQVVEQVQELEPELIVLTGDYVNFHPDELQRLEVPLRQLRARLGVYGCLGNHDHYMSSQQHRQLLQRLERMGVEVLVNENRVLSRGGARLQLAGTDNTGAGQRFARLEQALEGLDPAEPIVLLFHDPRFWEQEVVGKAPVAVGLCGHTHGGQIGISWGGLEWSLAQVVYRYWAGLYRVGEQVLYVNRGLGFVGPAVRMGIPPEITLLTLRRMNPAAPSSAEPQNGQKA